MQIRNFIIKPLEQLTSNEFVPAHIKNSFLEPKIVEILIKKNEEEVRENDEVDLENGKQIPVISDIERIKKIIQVVEFVGEKLGEVIDKLELPTTSPGYFEQEKGTEIMFEE